MLLKNLLDVQAKIQWPVYVSYISVSGGVLQIQVLELQ